MIVLTVGDASSSLTEKIINLQERGKTFKTPIKCGGLVSSTVSNKEINGGSMIPHITTKTSLLQGRHDMIKRAMFLPIVVGSINIGRYQVGRGWMTLEDSDIISVNHITGFGMSGEALSSKVGFVVEYLLTPRGTL